MTKKPVKRCERCSQMEGLLNEAAGRLSSAVVLIMALRQEVGALKAAQAKPKEKRRGKR